MRPIDLCLVLCLFQDSNLIVPPALVKRLRDLIFDGSADYVTPLHSSLLPFLTGREPLSQMWRPPVVNDQVIFALQVIHFYLDGFDSIWGYVPPDDFTLTPPCIVTPTSCPMYLRSCSMRRILEPLAYYQLVIRGILTLAEPHALGFHRDATCSSTHSAKD